MTPQVPPSADVPGSRDQPNTDWLSLAARFFFPESGGLGGKKLHDLRPGSPQDELDQARLAILREPAEEGSRDLLARNLARTVRLWRKASPERQKYFLNVLAWISDYYRFFGETEKSLRSCELVERWGRKRGNWPAVAASYLARGNVHHFAGRTQEAIRAYQEARHLCDWVLESRLHRARVSVLEAESWRRLGNIKMAMGLLTQAVDDSMLAVHTQLTSDDVSAVPYDEIALCISGLQGLGGILEQTGNQKTAFSAFEMAYRISKMQGFIEKQYEAALGMVSSRNRMGLAADAGILEELESRSQFAVDLKALADACKGDNLALKNGSPTHALGHYRQALSWGRQQASSAVRLGVHRRLAEFWVDRDHARYAELHLRWAGSLQSEGTEAGDRLALERIRDEVIGLRGKGTEVLDSLVSHFESATEVGFEYESLITAHRIAVIADEAGQVGLATTWWERARYLAELCGSSSLFDRWSRERSERGHDELESSPSPLADYAAAKTPVAEGDSAVPGILQKGLPTVDLAAHGIITRSRMMEQQASWIAKIAPTSLPVLIRGESGTGKELFATLVHALSPRRASQFITINCGALPQEIIESELFGHRRGSFTGAIKDRAGLVMDTHKGTLFLDEIGDMPLALQPKLLRTLELGEVRRVGDTHATRVDVRFVAATNQDLEKAIESGMFREDLYFRLKGLEIVLPPLRERPEDIEPLARHFLARVNERSNLRMTLPPETVEYLLTLPWKGNVRELKYSLDRAALIATPSTEIRPEHFGGVMEAGPGPQGSLKEELLAFERSRVLVALERARWNKAEAARLLGLTRTTPNSRLQKLRIQPPARFQR